MLFFGFALPPSLIRFTAPARLDSLKQEVQFCLQFACIFMILHSCSYEEFHHIHYWCRHLLMLLMKLELITKRILLFQRIQPFYYQLLAETLLLLYLVTLTRQFIAARQCFIYQVGGLNAKSGLWIGLQIRFHVWNTNPCFRPEEVGQESQICRILAALLFLRGLCILLQHSFVSNSSPLVHYLTKGLVTCQRHNQGNCMPISSITL